MAWRKLQPNEGCQIARHLIFVDTETRSKVRDHRNLGVNKLWFGVAKYCRMETKGGELKPTCEDELIFRGAGEFWEWVKQKSGVRKTTWIYAHNAGFDFIILGLLPLLKERELVISKPRKYRNKETGRDQISGMLMIDGPPFVVGAETKEGHRLVFLDTLNYWRTSLSALGRELGFPKLEMPHQDACFADWARYCRQDVEVIRQAVVNLITWWKSNDLGNWRYTAPGLAMSAFRHKFTPRNLVFHDEPDVRKLERDSYFGGQLEAYYLGSYDRDVWQYDVVSLYPSVMRNNLYPVKLLGSNTNAEIRTLKLPFEPSASIAEVELSDQADTFPYRSKEMVYYARGPGRVVLAGPELAYAVERGWVEAFYRWSAYEMEDIFTDYVNYFYKLKEQYGLAGKDVQKTFVKMLLNSLYGKFGQRGSSWVANPERMDHDQFGIFYESNLITKETTKCLSLMSVVFDQVKDKEIERAAPSIASFVTSYARQHMRMLRQIAGERNYLYQSTDSLIVNAEGMLNLMDHGKLIGDQLGGLKLEVDASSCWIGGLHYYKIGNKLVEGSKKASAITTGEHSWDELHFESFISVVQRARSSMQDSDGVTISEVSKSRRLEYDKAQVEPDGFTVPYSIRDIAQGQDECVI